MAVMLRGRAWTTLQSTKLASQVQCEKLRASPGRAQKKNISGNSTRGPTAAYVQALACETPYLSYEHLSRFLEPRRQAARPGD